MAFVAAGEVGAHPGGVHDGVEDAGGAVDVFDFLVEAWGMLELVIDIDGGRERVYLRGVT
jgi:hypothetical protein